VQALGVVEFFSNKKSVDAFLFLFLRETKESDMSLESCHVWAKHTKSRK